MFIKLCFWKTINSRFIMSLCKLMSYVRKKKKISLRIKVDILFLDFFFCFTFIVAKCKKWHSYLFTLKGFVRYWVEKHLQRYCIRVCYLLKKIFYFHFFFIYIYIYQIHVRNSEYISVTAAKHSRNMNRIRNKYVIAQHSCNSVRNALL